MSRSTDALTPAPTDPRRATILLAFAAVYLIWGSTYLAIRFAIETMPPLTMAAARFFAAGGLLYAWSRATGSRAPTRSQWRDAAVAGTLMLGGGNGAVVVAEQWVASGRVALLVASVPLWLVVLDALFGSKTRPRSRTTVGLLVGFGAVAFLAYSPAVGGGGARGLAGGILVLAGAAAWAMGSLCSLYTTDTPRPRMWVAMQMLTGALALTLMAAVSGDLWTVDIASISARSWWALVYLILFGALIAYTAYIWLLGVSTPARVGTYAYVNPVVALVLGWSVANEPLTFRSVVAAAIILGSVVMITSEADRGLGTRGAVSGRLRSRST